LQGFADAEGIVFTKQFFAIWPGRDVSEFAIAAILSSPIANTFFEAEDISRRDNRILTLAKLPLPPLTQLQPDGILHRHALALQELLAVRDFQQPPEEKTVHEAVLRLDAAVLDAYGLDAAAQTRLMRQFNGWARPLPPPFDQSFKEYFPAHFEEEITVSELLAITNDWEKTSRKKTALIEKKIRKTASEKELATLKRLKFLTEARGEFYAPLSDWSGPKSEHPRRAAGTSIVAV
jgi:3-methyladenine DNA glycosylase AlkC